jgi:hypothetical protein
LQEPGGGHFDVSDEKVAYLALYLKKAAQYRLGTTLKPIDPTKQGWSKSGFWHFDEEIAKVTETFKADQKTKKAQLVGFIQDDKVVEQNPKLHMQILLKFLPLDDGISFKLTGTFLDTVPEGRPEGWTGLPKGSPISRASGPVTIHRICGPVVQTSANTWSIRFYRMGMNNAKRSNEICFFASHPGDAEYKRAVQQAGLHFPLRNTTGKDQCITFPEIQPDLKLKATSDSGLPVYYYVREGPAEIEGDTLKLTRIPLRAKFPVKIAIIAWQWGRSIEPKVKTAEPVEHTFAIFSK